MSIKLFKNANIYTPVDSGKPAAGKAQGELNHFPNGAMLVENGIIKAVGDEKDVLSAMKASHVFICDADSNCRYDETLGGEDRHIDMEIDCNGQCLIPGFVDPHTHMCFAKRREAEFEMRIQGTPYLEILAKGGGILSSVKAVAEASKDALVKNTRKHVMSALKLGTTTVEIKSGYGLDTENELKMLDAINAVARTTPMDVVATFLGAHAIPTAYKENSDAFIDRVIDEMLPAVKEQGIARFCDIFCEEGVFTIEQGRRVLIAAQKMGFKAKIHADEVHDLGGAGLAAEITATSADHLLAASDENMEKMASAGCVADLLPATAYSLRKPYARARVMIEKNLPVALATDCNPGSSYTESMPFIIGLAVLNMDMTPAEALTAATLNSAYAIDMAKKVGSLDVGKQADFLLINGDSPAILAYHAGVAPIEAVYKFGERVV